MSKETRNFLFAMGAYVLVTILTVSYTRSAEPGALRTFIGLLPVIPGIFVVLSVVQQIMSLDEMLKQVQLEALAIGFGGMFISMLMESFEVSLGSQPTSPGLRLMLMAIWWVAGLIVARRRFEGAES